VTPLRKASVFALGILVLAALALGAAGRAAAAQGAPSWATGDTWVYGSSSGNGTMTWTVQEQATVTVGANTYNVWHVTDTSASGSVAYTVDRYFTIDGFRLVKTSETLVVAITRTYDPPKPIVVFPATVGSSWSGTSTRTNTVGSITTTASETWSGSVTGETSVTVPAGTFTAAVIRSPSTGNPYDLNYYSDSVGWMVKTEHYNGAGTLTGSANLSSYKYTGNVLLLVLLVIGVLIVIAAAGVLLLRRRRPRMPQAMPPQAYPPPQPSYPPQQPPQGPPGPGP